MEGLTSAVEEVRFQVEQEIVAFTSPNLKWDYFQDERAVLWEQVCSAMITLRQQ
jgi:hypothetical protein